MKKILSIFMLTGMISAPLLGAEVMNDIKYVLDKLTNSIPLLMDNAAKARINSLVKNLKAALEATDKSNPTRRALFRLAVADLATIRPLLRELIEFNTKNKGLITDITDKFGARDAAIIMNNIYEITSGLILIFEKVAGVEDPEYKALRELEAKQKLEVVAGDIVDKNSAEVKAQEAVLAHNLLDKAGLNNAADIKAGSVADQKAEIEDLKKLKEQVVEAAKEVAAEEAKPKLTKAQRKAAAKAKAAAAAADQPA